MKNETYRGYEINTQNAPRIFVHPPRLALKMPRVEFATVEEARAAIDVEHEPTYKTADELIASMSSLGLNVESYRRIIEHGSFENLDHLWEGTHQNNICCGRVCAWISRTGMVYSCGYGRHEQLLNYMGVEVYTAEQAGWVRVSGTHSPSNVQGQFRPTAAQKRVLIDMEAWDYIDQEADYWVRLTPYEDAPVISQYEQ